AGVPLDQSFVETTAGELRRQWDTNVFSLVMLTKLALPALIDSRGVVINIGSTAGHFSIPGWGMYFSTKVSVRSVSDSLRRELRAYGVRVALVEPGPYATEFGARAGMQTSQSGLPPAAVARVIVKLAARPRAVATVPWYFGPLVNLGGALTALAPGLVDLVFFAIGARNLRKQQEQQGAAGA
ncbi:MAG: SDR family NAD(P)-dependent oxidoreductase, partial [Roseiflexaceae bacterium]|nr:SDR family NAD(P)-dependent oxidoreductase [Roseiflexaceae bacterium]